MDFSPLECGTFDEYLAACKSHHRSVFEIPLFRPSHDSYRQQSTLSSNAPATMPPISLHDWKQEAEEMSSRGRFAKPLTRLPGYRILVSASPAALCAVLLAGYLDLPFEIVRDPFHRAKDEIKCGASKLLLVGLAQDYLDNDLLSLIIGLGERISSHQPWDRLPNISLVTARDLAACSWIVYKMIVAQPVRRLPRRIAHFIYKQDSLIQQQTMGESGSRETVILTDTAQLVTQLLAPTEVIVFTTHGTDACARGGLGVVLCGLRPTNIVSDGAEPGVLACGRGHQCPRGPRPLPLSQMRSSALMLASCNSLRLADSMLLSNFNLGLNFLDGGGISYIGSVLASAGGELSATVFCAAIASRRSISEATQIANAFLLLTGISDNAYFTVGAPWLRTEEEQLCSSVIQVNCLGRGVTAVNCGTLCLAELLIADVRVIHLMEKASLTFSAGSGKSGGPLYWFARLEISPDTSAPRTVRLFLFRFPEPLGVVRLRSYDSSKLINRSKRLLEGLLRWIEVARLSGLDTINREEITSLVDSANSAKQALARYVARVSYDGSIAHRLAEHRKLVCALADTARQLVLNSFAPQLSGPFWLSHIFAAEYLQSGQVLTSCINCNGAAMSRMVAHPLHRGCRTLQVCMRCGIVTDVRRNGSLAVPIIEAPILVEVGSDFEVVVVITTRTAEHDIVVAVGISGVEGHPIPHQVKVVQAAVQPGHKTRASFSFYFPPHLPPHQFVVKVLASSLVDIAFGSRILFAVPSRLKSK